MWRQILKKDSFILQGLLKLLISGEPQAKELFGIIYDDFKGKRPTRAARGVKNQTGGLSWLRLFGSDQRHVSVISINCGASRRKPVEKFPPLFFCFSFCSFFYSSSSSSL